MKPDREKAFEDLDKSWQELKIAVLEGLFEKNALGRWVIRNVVFVQSVLILIVIAIFLFAKRHPV